MLKIAPDRVGEEAVPCRFKLVNGDSYPKLPPESLLSSEDDRQILIRPAGRFEPRDPPLYFDVDPGVASVPQEHRIRFETFAQTRLTESSIMVLPEGSVVTDGFFTADRSKMALFAETEAVAGALGAGLTNSVFMPAGGTLIEFAPEQRQGDAVLFANLAHHRKLHYAGIVGSLDENSTRTFDRLDFSISPDMAAKAFSALE